MKQKLEFNEWIHIAVLSVLIIDTSVVIFAPSVCTGIASSGKYNFTDTGNIGATIGGISAPFVGILTAILRYLAFYAQFQANKRQREVILKNELRKNEIETLNLNWKFNDNIKADFYSENYSSQKKNILRLNPSCTNVIPKIILFTGLNHRLLIQIEQTAILVAGFKDHIIKDHNRLLLMAQFSELFNFIKPDSVDFVSEAI